MSEIKELRALLKRALSMMHPGRYCDDHRCPCEDIRAQLAAAKKEASDE
jgi:hypothetical protein